MIDLVDLVLRQTLVARVPGLANAQVGFQPPDDTWRSQVGGAAQGVFLNCCLVDLRENRRLRQGSRESGPSVAAGAPSHRRAPVQVRCLYLLSAWNGARDSPQVAATEQEHALLGAVIGALVAAGPLVPAAVLTPQQLARVPVPLQEGPLPVELLPADGFTKLAEFWGTMGRPAAWKPVVPVTVTVPVLEAEPAAGRIVRSVTTRYGLLADGSPAGDPLEIRLTPS
ncbi:Pvc16 family protein [Streptomyces sp. NPDC000658]|uniref:Pvc16 family protein n=1 Tax=Streptomyces sp. NPDC000658 TaxID=3154266 RepID=UPI003332AD1A